MLNKKIMILVIFLVSLLAVSAVSAADNVTSDVVSVEEDQVIEQTEIEEIISTTDNGTFTALQKKIDNAEAGSTIILENDYLYDDGFDIEGISISKELTIHGNGHSIDALKKSRIFKIIAGNIVLTDLTLKNGYSDRGGAIYVSGGYSNYVFDCNFADNSANYGGAIYFNTASNGDKFLGVFINNSAEDGGAIVFHSGLQNAIFNGSFYNNIASESGGAISISGDCSNSIFDGYFENNNAKEAGGAFYLSLLSGSVKNTKFIGIFVNNNAGDIGGAIYVPSGYYNEFSGTFINNSAKCGGALGIYSAVMSNKICGSFDENNANWGGAVYIACIRNEGNVIDKAIFRNNTAEFGSAVYFRDDIPKTVTIQNSIFVNNNGTIIFSGVGTDIKIDCCWFGNTADNYNIAPNVNENVHITNWLFLNASANPMKIFPNHNSIIAFSLSNLYDSSSREIRTVEVILPKINLNIFYKNGNGDKEIVLLDEKITYTLISNSNGIVIGHYNGIEYAIVIKCLNNVNLIAPDISGYYGHNTTFNIKLTENNIPLINEPIKIKLNNQSYIIFTDDKGQSSIDLDLVLDVGNYTIISEYYGLTIPSNYVVNKADSILFIDNINGTAHQEINLTAIVVSSNNLVINEGNVTFMDNGKIIGASEVVNGIARLNYAPPYGEHTISAVYLGNNYLSSKNNLTVFIDRKEVVITSSNITTVYNSDESLIVNVRDTNGLAVSYALFIIKIDNEPRIVLTDENGQIEVPTKEFIPKFYSFEISVADDRYSASNVTAYVIVNKAPTTLTSSSITTVYNVGRYLVATLKDNQDNPIQGATISINLNGVKKLTTDANGQVKLATNALVPKTYTTTITYAGDDKYVGSSATVKVTIKKATPKLTAKNMVFKVKTKTKKYAVTLKDNNNKVMKSTGVTLKVNKKTYKVKTNSKGQATFKITNLNKKGTYTAVVKYAGNSCYNAKTVKPKIIVK